MSQTEEPEESTWKGSTGDAAFHLSVKIAVLTFIIAVIYSLFFTPQGEFALIDGIFNFLTILFFGCAISIVLLAYSAFCYLLHLKPHK